MNNQEVWEREYQQPKLLTLNSKPGAALLDFLRWLKKGEIKTENWKVLDLGSGTGRNANYLAVQGYQVTGVELSSNAIKLAEERAKAENLIVKYFRRDFGEPFPLLDNSFDLVIDIMSSNSLDEKEREVYLRKAKRVLKPGGWFFLRALCKDGDKNAKELIRRFPGPERDTYIMPELGLTERVFSKEDLIQTYGRDFKIVELTREAQYVRLNNRRYKRFYWVAYMQNV